MTAQTLTLQSLLHLEGCSSQHLLFSVEVGVVTYLLHLLLSLWFLECEGARHLTLRHPKHSSHAKEQTATIIHLLTPNHWDPVVTLCTLRFNTYILHRLIL
jgi:hypothetical protein